MHFVRLCVVLLLTAGPLAAQNGKAALSPAGGQQGAIVQVTMLSPVLDDKGASIAFEPAGALTVSSLQLLNRQLHFSVSISPSAKPGPYALIYSRLAMTNAAAPLRFDNAFTVIESPKAVPVTVRSIRPSVILAGGPPVTITITGMGFQPGAKVTFMKTSVQALTNSASAQQITAILTAKSNTAAGGYPFVIRNPDGSSNADQSPLPLVQVMQPAPAATLPSDPPPPPTAPPSTPAPPSEPPPATAPPATTTPLPPPPPVEPPATAPPVVVTTPSVTLPPVTPPPVAPTPLPTPEEPKPPEAKPPSKPIEIPLLAPRIDIVKPMELAPGEIYSLDFEGRNLGLDTKLSFGDDITFVGAPLFTSSMRGSAMVIVGSAAKPGPAIAVAQNKNGSNNGPGAIYISTRATNSIRFLEPFLTSEGVTFRWKETTPGLAKFYLFEVIDVRNTILYSAQTKQTSLVVPRDRIAYDTPAYARVKGYADQSTIAETSELQLLPK